MKMIYFSDIGDSGEEFILNQDNETQDDDGNHAYAQIYKNNAGAGGNASIFGYHNSGDSDQMANVTTIMDMAANDFATAVLSPASGSSSYYGAATYFSGFLIG